MNCPSDGIEEQVAMKNSVGRSIVAAAELMSDDDRRTYTPEEVARMLGLHSNSVYTMLKTGELPAVRAGRKWLISKRRFEAWLDGGDG